MIPQHQSNRNVAAFDHDATENLGYLYTTNAQLSSILANRRLTDMTSVLADFSGKRVIDIGCGDGIYTVELHTLHKPASIHGIDPVASAIEIAQSRTAGQAITFSVENAYDLPFADDSFDIAYLRGVLHHMDHPVKALSEAFRVAQVLVVIEPNGYSPILKVIERISSYHREHNEKSYSPARLDNWVRSVGGKTTAQLWAGLVPMFCPDWFARMIKIVEPVLEAIPLINRLFCAVYAFRAERRI